MAHEVLREVAEIGVEIARRTLLALLRPRSIHRPGEDRDGKDQPPPRLRLHPPRPRFEPPGRPADIVPRFAADEIQTPDHIAAEPCRECVHTRGADRPMVSP